MSNRDKFWGPDMDSQMQNQGNSNQRKNQGGQWNDQEDNDNNNEMGDWKNPERSGNNNNVYKSKRVMSGGSSMSPPPPHHANRRSNNISGSGQAPRNNRRSNSRSTSRGRHFDQQRMGRGRGATKTALRRNFSEKL